MRLASLSIASVIVTLVAVSACRTEAPYTIGPPDGWEADGLRWWRVGADTTNAFPDFETLASMKAKNAEITYAADSRLSRQKDLATRQLSRAVKQSLIPLFRNQPQVVDSLFEQFVVPRIAEADMSQSPEKLVDRYKKEAYRTLARHFREPRTIVELGRDVPVAYPDSLRQKGVTGRVEMQLRLNKEGEPIAMKMIEGVHPVIDDIAMKAVTQVRWQPAYLLGVGKSHPIASWVRFTVNFATG